MTSSPVYQGYKRYLRQVVMPAVGTEGQRRLQDSKVAILGQGALGTVSANSLARAGVGYLRLVDRDYVDYTNLQRQVLFDEEDVSNALPKVIAAAKKLHKINSEIEYEPVIADIDHNNIKEFIADVDLVLDATDNFAVRLLINEACVKYSIPWIHGACLSSYGVTFNIFPGETPCFLCYLGKEPEPGTADTCDTAGIMGPVVNIVASIQAAEAFKYLTGNREALNSTGMYLDLWQNRFYELPLIRNKNCKVCVEHNYTFLEGHRKDSISYLCGSNAVQIVPAEKEKNEISLQSLAEKFANLGTVFNNNYLIKFIPANENFEITLFADGRALIKGTTDEKVARTVYARYIGI